MEKNTTLLHIEYQFALAQAEAYRVKAQAIKELLEGDAPRVTEEAQMTPQPEMSSPVEVPSNPLEMDEPPPLLQALQVIIGDAAVTTVDQIYHALRKKEWVPLGSRDPLTYVRHTLSKNKDIFLREHRGRYSLSHENPYKKMPTLVETKVWPASVEAPAKKPTQTSVKPEYTPEEIQAANEVVDQVLSMHRAATNFFHPRPPQEAARIVHAAVNPNSPIAQEVREMVRKNAESASL